MASFHDRKEEGNVEAMEFSKHDWDTYSAAL
jgi:hypothetical protein